MKAAAEADSLTDHLLTLLETAIMNKGGQNG
jgi:hypothetical protein